MRWRCGRCHTPSPIASSSCGATSNAATVERRGTSIPDYLDWRDKSQSFDLIGAWSNGNFVMYGAGEPTQVGGEFVSDNYFAMLGVEPLLGRTLTPQDDVVGGPLGGRDRRALVGARVQPRSECDRTIDSARQLVVHDRRRCAGGVHGPLGRERGLGVDARPPGRTPSPTGAAADSPRSRGSRQA